MKLRELDTTTGQPDAGVADPSAESIRIARLPPVGDPDAATHSPGPSVEVEPYPAPRGEAGRPTASEPARLRFVTEQPRATLLDSRTVLRAIAAMVTVGVVLIVIASNSGGAGHAHRSAARLTPAEQRVVAAERARAAAIAKAKRDRGTDAELQDTIPAATPPPSP